MLKIWFWIASPGASLIAGLACLLLLWLKNRRATGEARMSRANIASTVLLAASLYTMIVLVVGEFFVGARVSETIKNGFGDGRVAWLLVALALDTGSRLAALFGHVKD